MKTNLHSIYKTDQKSETEGVWYSVGNGVRFLVKRFGGKNEYAMAEKTAKYYSPYTEQMQKNELDQDTKKELTIKVFVHACIADWDGVVDDKDNPVDFNADECVDILCELDELADDLINFSSNRNNYKERVGNS